MSTNQQIKLLLSVAVFTWWRRTCWCLRCTWRSQWRPLWFLGQATGCPPVPSVWWHSPLWSDSGLGSIPIHCRWLASPSERNLWFLSLCGRSSCRGKRQFFVVLCSYPQWTCTDFSVWLTRCHWWGRSWGHLPSCHCKHQNILWSHLQNHCAPCRSCSGSWSASFWELPAACSHSRWRTCLHCPWTGHCTI